jgi:hypothetical protein
MIAAAVSFSIERGSIELKWGAIASVVAIITIAFLVWFFLRKSR